MTPRAKAIAAMCAAAFLALAFSACKGRKAALRPLDLGGEQMALAQACPMLEGSYREWASVQCPVALAIDAPQRASVSGRCTMVRDSLIYFSLRAMGMEAAVIRITPDSAWIIDRYNGAYLAEPLDSILGGYPLGIADMQSLLMGRAFVPSPALPAESAMAAIAPGPAPALLSIALAGPAGQRAAFIYADTASTPAGPMAADIAASLRLRGLAIDASMQWKLKDAKWNTGRRPQFRRPKPGYKRLSPSDLAY